MSTIGSYGEWCFSTIIGGIMIHILPFPKNLHDSFVSTPSSNSELSGFRRGVPPILSAVLGLTSSRSSSIFTTLSCPFQEAMSRGVRPSLFILSVLTSLCSKIFKLLGYAQRMEFPVAWKCGTFVWYEQFCNREKLSKR